MPYKNIEDKRRYNRERMRRKRAKEKEEKAKQDAKKFVFGSPQKAMRKPSFAEWLEENYPNGTKGMDKRELFMEYQEDLKSYGVLNAPSGFWNPQIQLPKKTHDYDRYCPCDRCCLIRKYNLTEEM